MSERNTKTKKCIEELFRVSSYPLSTKEIFTAVKSKLPQTAYSTVWRIIQQLTSQQKLTTISWYERGSRYEWAKRKHHHHLICEQCGHILDIDDSIISYKEVNVSKKTGFIITNHSVEITGICPPCQIK